VAKIRILFRARPLLLAVLGGIFMAVWFKLIVGQSWEQALTGGVAFGVVLVLFQTVARRGAP
jgi:membrane associated rhomboid family serine protease